MSDKEKQLIISVSREYGAGGHEIAGILAEKFEIPLLDADSIAQHFADSHNFDAEEVKKYSGKPFNKILHRTVQGYTNTIQDNLSQMQFEYLRELAEAGESFVIVGRCSETILSEYRALFSVFVLADEKDKVARVMEREGLNETDAGYTAKRGTWNHKSYHNYYCKGKWGDSRLYDICVNSSTLGVKRTADMLELYIREFVKKQQEN